jgi:hypothetical protein
VSWVGGQNPNQATIFIADRSMTILDLNGVVEVQNGAAASATVVKTSSGQPLSSGTPIHSGSFDANGSVGSIQSLTLTTTAMNAGDRLGILTAGTFGASEANLTVSVQ